MKKVIIAIIALIIGFVIWYASALRPFDPDSHVRITVRIPSGSSISTIAHILEKERIVRSAFAFRIYLQWNEPDAVLQAGSFVFRSSMSIREIIKALTGGIASEEIITIPEGFSMKEIDVLLAKKELIKEGELVRCANECDFTGFHFLPHDLTRSLAPRGGLLEGYVFPDTYFVLTEGFVAKFFLERLLSTFEKRVIESYKTEIKTSGRTLHQLITMASIIEKETRTDAERSIVSGILWKRFDDERGLEADAALRYILEKPTETITGTDLNVDSPYNIRKFRGLPPGPIGNPGISSILSALRPQKSEYWYYLHGDDREIRYAITNEEHNINRYKYLK